ncbi:radical SAM protein [Patescibacteria group bacterium]|nr:radical SAM protein [Patescibacteria group bacterium]
MQVYQFKMWGKSFAVDIGSGNFFEVDKIAAEAITLLHRYPEREVMHRLSGKYEYESVAVAIRNLSKLKKKRILFSPVQVKNDRDIERKITDVTLNIVNNCNLRCRYCWNQSGAYGGFFTGKQKMEEKVAFKAVNLLIKESKGAKDLVVDFYGGEPLLNFNLIRETVEYCRKIQKKKKINFRFLLATNGTLLTEERAKFLIENGVDIAVSLDGSKKIQDVQRPFPDGRGSFEVIIDNINSLKGKYRRRIVGRATFTPYYTKIISTFKFLRGLGFERIEVCESEKAGYGLESNNQFFFSGPDGLRKLKSLYYNLAIFYTQEIIKGSLAYENTYFNRFFKQLSRLYHIQSVVGTCSAGFSLIAVDMDGSLYPCTAFIGIPECRIGTVNNGINEKKLKNFTAIKISSSDACNKCWARRICRGCGSCYNLNYFANKNLREPNPYYCELFRYKTKLMIAMISEMSKKDPQLLDKVLIPEYYATRGKRKGEKYAKNTLSKASEVSLAFYK